jgi:DNA primase
MIFDEVAQYFKKKLREYQNVYQYLIDRGFSDEIIERFDLGYFPVPINKLFEYFDPTQLKAYGIVNDASYSVIQDRLIFPIRSLHGNVIAFAGRTLLSEQDRKAKKIPKYINTSYLKGKHVYGLYYAKEEMRRKDAVVITEGYPDVVISNQFSINNIVCTGGTAFTQHQIGLLARYATVFYLVFNSDEAGIKARDRTLDLLKGKDKIVVRQVPLPFESDVKDIDDFLHKYGRDTFLKLFEEKQDNQFENLVKQIAGS